MDPQIKSLLTSFGMMAATAIAGAAATHGYIHSADQTVVADSIVTAVGAAISGFLTWYKSRQVSPTAAIQQVNLQDNGATVVPTSSARAAGIPTVNAPLK